MAVVLEPMLLVASLIVLATASHIVLLSGIKLSRLFGLREFSIGFILVAMTTTLPELSVSISGAFRGEGGIVIGNVIGSNIMNILVILGISALIGSMRMRDAELRDTAPVLFLATIIPLFLLGGASIGFVGGVVLLLIFAAYIYHIYSSKPPKDHKKPNPKGALKVIFAFAFGMAFTLIAADLAVSSAASIAEAAGIAHSIIGLTIIAFGTSLPELSVAVNALIKGHSDLAFGDVIGACLINLTLVLGIGAVIRELTINPLVFQFSILFLVGVSSLLIFSLLRYKGIPKQMGLVFLVLYIIFIMAEIGLITFI